MPHYQVQRGIDPPQTAVEKFAILAELEVNESFTAPAKEAKTLSNAIVKFQKRTPKKFRYAKEDNVTIRCWRIE